MAAMVPYKVIGQSTPRIEHEDVVTGAARYAVDVTLPGMLWARVLHSPLPHARIVRVNTSRAARVPGVHLVLTGADVKGVRYGGRSYVYRGGRPAYMDVPVLAWDKVRFVGDRVAAVVADDPDTAERAVDLIDVEYEELPAVFDPIEAMRDLAPLVHPEVMTYPGLPEPLDRPSNVFSRERKTRGDVDAGFAEADLIVENTYTVQRTHQAYLEPHNCVVWVDGDGRIQVWAPNKAPHQLKASIAEPLGLSPDQVRLNPVLIGGDFGGKGAAMEEPLCTVLALRTGRPVKMVMSYSEELTAAAPRHAGRMQLKTGVKRDGAITAHQVDAVFDSGAYGGLRPLVPLGGPIHGADHYKIPNARLEVVRVYTNNIPGGQARAPGEPQGFFAAESHMDYVARQLGMDPLEFRMKNLVGEGDEMVSGGRYRGVRARETLHAAAEAAGYGSPKPTNVGRGVAIGHRSAGGGESAVTLTLAQDGSVIVSTSVFEQGTGTYTSLRQVVAEELGLSPDHVQVNIVDTDLTPFDSGIGGSHGTRIVTGSAYQAARQAKAEMLAVAAEALMWPAETLAFDGDDVLRADTGERRAWRELLAELGRPLRVEAVNDDTARSPVTAFVAHVAEVSVDPETGAVELLRLTAAHDVGTVLNPLGHQGQVYGGAVQGLGYALMEDLQVEDGRVRTSNFGDFKIPTMRDIPEFRTVLLEPGEGVGPYNVRGIGENSIIPVAAAVANAVEDAVGIRIADLPVTAEKVFRALHPGE